MTKSIMLFSSYLYLLILYIIIDIDEYAVFY